MHILYNKHINAEENNRTEFLLIDFDYYNGNDFLAKLFVKNYGMEADDKFDGIYYSIIKLHLGNTEYNLVWHEDIGNYLYSTQQDKTTLNLLEDRLKSIIKEISV